MRSLICILRKEDPAVHTGFLGNDPNRAATFLWGRIFEAYNLFIRGRIYSLPKQEKTKSGRAVLVGDISSLTKHIRRCIDMDTAFYGENYDDIPIEPTIEHTVTDDDVAIHPRHRSN